METRTKKIINIVLLIIWLVAIFYFSHQAAPQSSALSSKVTVFVFYNPVVKNHIPNLLLIMVRKIAHISEFFILTVLMYNVVKYYIFDKKVYLYTLILSVLYACSDEIHQFFVPGRTCLLGDVLVDSIGIILALILIILFKYCKSKLVERIHC